MDMQSLSTLTAWIREAESTVFFGGAGVSTESGVPDFRSSSGIYAGEGGAERYLSIDYMHEEPDAFYDFYRKYFILTGILPNPAHLKLAEMEEKGRLSSVITQNIDSLHQKAGSRKVIELHGNGERFYCERCKTSYSPAEISAGSGAFYCKKPGCGGFVRPDIVMYGEALDFGVLDRALEEIARADLLIAGGSSLAVYPAAGLLGRRKRSSRLVMINLDPTPYDGEADLIIREPIGRFMAGIRLESR